MRVWDVDPSCLCANHLLGEHREIHAIWSILTQGKTGYSKHPETKRWDGKLAALYRRHEENIAEMERRGYNHNSPLDKALATGSATQDSFVDSFEKQKEILRNKGCNCRI
jgi:hypothetical protein